MKKIIFLVIILVSCSSNKEKYLFEKYYELDSFKTQNIKLEGINAIDFDDNGNAYLLDAIKTKAYIFDKNWKLKKTFLKKGKAPGEFRFFPGDIKVAFNRIYILEDYLLNIYDLEGNFIVSNKKIIASQSNIAVNKKDSLIYIGCPISKTSANQKVLLYQCLDINGNLKENIYFKSNIFNKIKGHETTFVSVINNKIVVNFEQINHLLIFNNKNEFEKDIKLQFNRIELKNPNGYVPFSLGPLIDIGDGKYLLRKFSTKTVKDACLFDAKLNYIDDIDYNEEVKRQLKRIDCCFYSGYLYFWQDYAYSSKLYEAPINIDR